MCQVQLNNGERWTRNAKLGVWAFQVFELHCMLAMVAYQKGKKKVGANVPYNEFKVWRFLIGPSLTGGLPREA